MVDRFEKWRFRNNDGAIIEGDLELHGNIKGNQSLDVEHGAGAVGTYAPQLTRTEVGGIITTNILFDFTGISVLGTQAKDSIGKAGGALFPSYIGRYTVAKCGVLFKVSMTCLTVPTEGTATINADIDLGFDGVGTMYMGDGVAIDDIVINGATFVRGETVQNLSPLAAASDNDYIYLIEGGTTATTGIYADGCYLIQLFGHQIHDKT